MEEKIIQRTLKLFRTRGLRTVTMDDVAQELGMSKRTLYQFYKNKEDFFRQCVDYRIRQWGLHEQADSDATVLDLLMNYADCFDQQPTAIDYRCCKYIWTNHQDVYQYIFEHIERFATRCGNKVESSIRLGLIRPDVTPDLVYLFLLSHFTHLFVDNGLRVESDEKRVMKQLVQVFIRGISTPEGEAYLNNKTK